ncbi:nickel import ATP-binding protein NikD [Arsenophonus sp. PmNCSU2021_1]|uniref:nickel import ATP-binding protein NikD n=1 Tax=Arsenophonus sp. PmNCSU2021_1 TaxID=3118989 RepID=UPI002FF2387F
MSQKIELQNITLKAQRLLVQDVSLTINKGKVLALVGSSGCGKSLTCAAMLGILPAGVNQTAGSLLLDGDIISAQQLRGSHIATIMQNPRSAFNPLNTMASHIQETCRALGKPVDIERINITLQSVGLENASHILSLYPFEMSGGMLQRLMIAIAILSDAPFIIADEPTTDLDTVAQTHILDLLENTIQTRAVGMLLVTHDMGVVARLADDVAVMHDGKIVEYSNVNTIFNTPKHQITHNLVAAHLALYDLRFSV